MGEPIEIVDTEPEVFSLPLEELRRLLVMAISDHRAAMQKLAQLDTYNDAGFRELGADITQSDEYQAALKDEALALEQCDIYRAEIQIREDARLDRQMAQRDRELDILAGSLALDERKQAHLEQQGEVMAEQLAALRESMEAVHADHGGDFPPISTSRGRA